MIMSVTNAAKYTKARESFVNTVSSQENCSIACNICDTKYITLRSLIHHLRNAHNVYKCERAGI